MPNDGVVSMTYISIRMRVTDCMLIKPDGVKCRKYYFVLILFEITFPIYQLKEE